MLVQLGLLHWLPLKVVWTLFLHRQQSCLRSHSLIIYIDQLLAVLTGKNLADDVTGSSADRGRLSHLGCSPGFFFGGSEGIPVSFSGYIWSCESWCPIGSFSLCKYHFRRLNGLLPLRHLGVC